MILSTQVVYPGRWRPVERLALIIAIHEAIVVKLVRMYKGDVLDQKLA